MGEIFIFVTICPVLYAGQKIARLSSTIIDVVCKMQRSATICQNMNDYGTGSNDYQTASTENSVEASDYASLTNRKLCPLKTAHRGRDLGGMGSAPLLSPQR